MPVAPKANASTTDASSSGNGALNGKSNVGGGGDGQNSPANCTGSRLQALQRLLAMVGPLPQAWLVGAKNGANRASTGSNGKMTNANGVDALNCLECNDYATLVKAWRKALKWTPGLDSALAVMLAVVASTKSVGDQLWVKIIGPASSGKSTLCEALSINEKYVLARSKIKGFHSGSKGEDGEDRSLIEQARDKTLIVKDGDTLMKMGNIDEILSEGRDLYDRTSRSYYRNGAGGDYVGVSMTWILAGTASLRAIDSSELGERFLDCVVMDGIDDDLEDEILWRVANRVHRNMAVESNGTAATQCDPELGYAMQLTGGYVSYLRENALDLLSSVQFSDERMRLCTRYGKFVAYMRSRPSKIQSEKDEREFAARLVSQHVRLASCLAVVLGKRMVDADVMKRTRKVCLDTSRGLTLRIADLLYKVPSGVEAKAVALHLVQKDEDTRKLLRFLMQIGVARVETVKVKGLSSTQQRWQLAPRMRKLYEEVKG